MSIVIVNSHRRVSATVKGIKNQTLFRIYLKFVYFIKIENFFVESTVDKDKN